MISKKTDEILKKCAEITSHLEGIQNEEVANRQIADLLEIVVKGTKCEKDIKEVLEMYWNMKDNSIQEYRKMI